MPTVTKGRTNHSEEKEGGPQGLTDTAPSDSADTQPHMSSWKVASWLGRPWKKPIDPHSSDLGKSGL